MFSTGGQQFPKAYNMTCGVDLSVKPTNVAGTEEAVELHIFDCGGQVSARRHFCGSGGNGGISERLSVFSVSCRLVRALHAPQPHPTHVRRAGGALAPPWRRTFSER